MNGGGYADMIPTGFSKSDGEIEGWLFNDGNEVVGKFNDMDVIGAYGDTHGRCGGHDG